MNKNLKYIIALLIFCIIAFLAYGFHFNKKEIIVSSGKLIPPIQLRSIDNKLISLKKESGKFHFLIFFDSHCEHCQAEAKVFQEHLHEFKNAEITFISMEKMRNIKIFAADYNLKNIPNVTFCQIEPEVLAQHFGNMGFPTIFIYNSENELVEKFSGEIKIENLTKYLE